MTGVVEDSEGATCIPSLSIPPVLQITGFKFASFQVEALPPVPLCPGELKMLSQLGIHKCKTHSTSPSFLQPLSLKKWSKSSTAELSRLSGHSPDTPNSLRGDSRGVFVHNAGTAGTVRTLQGGNWVFLLSLAIFLPLRTILHPTMLHNLMFHPPPPMPSTAPNCNLYSGRSRGGPWRPACLAWL